MNRLYGVIAMDIVCFAIFIALALAGRNAEEVNSESGDAGKSGKTTLAAKGSLKPRTGGRELWLAVDSEPQTLDPISITDTISDGIGGKIFNKLMRLQYDEHRVLKPVPDLAESVEITNENRLYTFKLRKGVRFHNGREVKAADFVYSLKRLMSAMSKRADLMNPFVKGSKAYCEFKSDDVVHDDSNLGIRAVDDYTLQIELDEPFAPFLQHLCTVSCAVVPREAAENKDVPLSRAPVGTGPFKLAEKDWVANQYLRLRRFDGYFAGKPKMEGVRFFIYKDKTLQIKRFMAGQLDACEIPNGQVKKSTEEAGEENVFTWPSARTNYIGIGMPNGPFKDKKDLSPFGTNKLLRQAMNYALDREYLCKTILEERGTPAIGVLPPGMPACKESRPGWKKDLVKARELMAQAGYPEGKGLAPITMLIRNDVDTKNIGQAMVNDFEKIGIRISLEAVDWNRFLEMVDKEPVPMFLLGWVADYPDPDNFLYVLFNAKQFNSAGNYMCYSNPEVDKLTEDARKLTDMSERAKLYERAEDIILDEAPWICTYHLISKVLLRKEVKGIRENATSLDTGTEYPQVEFMNVEVE